MAKFFEHPDGPLGLCDRHFDNKKVNIDMVITFDKHDKQYPGCDPILVIQFELVNGNNEMEWAFKTEKDRDKTYKKLLKGK